MFFILKGVGDWCHNQGMRDEISQEYREALLALSQACIAVMRFL